MLLRLYTLIFASIVTLYFLCGLSSSLQIDIVPSRHVDSLTKSLQISCVLGENETIDDLLVLQVEKEGKVLAILKGNKNASVEYGEDVEAEGYIENGNIGKSYLNLTIPYPDVEDSGVYTCKMYFLKDMILQEKGVSGNVTFDETSQKKQNNILRDILRKISSRDKQIKKMDNLNSQLLKKVNSLEGRLQSLTRLVSYLFDKVSNNMSTVAFSATNINGMSIPSTIVPIIFPDVIVNEGQGYNPKTGEFTVPKDGVYAFSLVISFPKNVKVEIDIQANHKPIAKLQIGGDLHSTQQSMSAIVKLKTGDVVCFVAPFNLPNQNLIPGNSVNRFSGYRISTD